MTAVVRRPAHLNQEAVVRIAFVNPKRTVPAISDPRHFDGDSTAENALADATLYEPYNKLSKCPMGLLMLQSLTPEGVECEHVDANFEVLDYEKLADFDMVALTGITFQAAQIHEIAANLRGGRCRTVCGGVHATVAPEETAMAVDCVVTGEAEGVWPRLLRDLEAGRLQRRYDGTRSDMASSPAPRYAALQKYRKAGDTMGVMIRTSAGCPHDCEFCSVRLIQGNRVRFGPVANACRDLRGIHDALGGSVRTVTILDDNFTMSKRRTLEVLRGLRATGIGYRFMAQGDISVADSDELMGEMVLAGMHNLQIGFESLEAGNLADVDRWKLKRRRDYARDIQRLQDYGINIWASFIVGLDDDDEGCFERLYRFLRESNIKDVQVSVLQPYPGTRLHRRLQAEGRLFYDGLPWHEVPVGMFSPIYQPRRMSARTVVEGLVWLTHQMYGTQEALERRRTLADQLAERRNSVLARCA